MMYCSECGTQRDPSDPMPCGGCIQRREWVEDMKRRTEHLSELVNAAGQEADAIVADWKEFIRKWLT